MCVVCNAFRPWTQDCAYAGTEGGARPAAQVTAAAAQATLSHAEIGEKLLTDFWEDEERRAFDVRPGDTLTYDVTQLTRAGKELARTALEEWSEATGLRFAEVSGGLRPEAREVERSDVAASTATDAAIGVNEVFDGRLTNGDRDWVRVELPSRGIVKIVVEGIGSDPLENPGINVFTASGMGIPIGVRHEADRAELSFQISGGGGAYHVQISGIGGGTGGYRLAVHEPDAPGVAQIVFDDEERGARATFMRMEQEILSAEVNVSKDWLERYGDEVGTYGFQTYLHEIGHALGLGHPGDYSGDARFAHDAEFANDSWQTTVMSYFNQWDNPNVEGDKAYALTPMAADLHAVRELYGRADAREGDTVYGHGSTAGGALDLVAEAEASVAFTIKDTGGHDLIDLSRERGGQRVDLTEGSRSDVFGSVGSMTIAEGTTIEDVRGGSGDDLVKGNRADNELRGKAGDDKIVGKGGDDVLRGGSGDDKLKGGKGDDRLLGDDGKDKLAGGKGDDVLEGGEGKDKLKGGKGADVFVFGGAFGKDTVKDFDAAEDSIDLADVAAIRSWAELRDDHLRGKGDRVKIDAGEDGLIKLKGVTLAELGAEHFDFG